MKKMFIYFLLFFNGLFLFNTYAQDKNKNVFTNSVQDLLIKRFNSPNENQAECFAKMSFVYTLLSLMGT